MWGFGVVQGTSFCGIMIGRLSDIDHNSPGSKCNRCGSDLILLSRKTERPLNSFSPITITTYRCSNQECQDEADRKVRERLELREARERARQDRLKMKPLRS